MSKAGISDLATALVEKHGLPVKDAEDFVELVFETLNDCLSAEKLVKIKGFGTFKITNVSARESVDVNTGERIMIDSRDKISFIPDTVMRDLVNRPFAQFETVIVNEGVDLSVVDDESRDENIEDEVVEAVANDEESVSVPTDNDVVEEPLVDTSEEATDVRQEDNALNDNGLHKRNILKPILACIAVIVILGVVYYIYLRQRHVAKTEVKSVVTEKRIAAHKRARKVENDTALISPKYDDDARVRTGAYNIVGIEDTVKVRSGQTLESISKNYLGPDMECYVEAVNGGVTEVKAGDTLRIPKLELKKRVDK